MFLDKLDDHQCFYEPLCFLGSDVSQTVNDEIMSEIAASMLENTCAIPELWSEDGVQYSSNREAQALNKNEVLYSVADFCCQATESIGSPFEPSFEGTTLRKALKLYDRESIGSRRKRADKIRSVFANSIGLHACNNMEVHCVKLDNNSDGLMPIRVRRTDFWENKAKSTISDKVIVAIEASHVCLLDVCIRHGLFSNEISSPFVTGSNFVGIVHDGPLPVGCRVAALTKTGGNARYTMIDPDEVVWVPKRLDSAEVSSVISTYLPVFQALHHGRPQRERYSQNSLQGKRILLTDGASMLEIQALVELSRVGGAASVHVVCEPRFHRHVEIYLAAKPLDVNPESWLSEVHGKMDVVIDFEYTNGRSVITQALAPRGRLVWYAHPPSKDIGCLPDVNFLIDFASILTLDRASIYNAYDYWGNEETRGDTSFLFGLLSDRKIRPKLDRIINLSGVRKAHSDLMKGGTFGAIICEPWRE